jgi:probable HAF family extracellular repeat protein
MDMKPLGLIAGFAVCSVVSPAASSSVGFIYSGGSYTALSYPGAPQTEAFGINNAGQVVGDYWDSGFHQGFLYSAGSFTTLSVPSFQQTIPFGINNAGRIVGYANNNNGLVAQGFLYSGGSYTPINDSARGRPGACSCSCWLSGEVSDEEK